MKVVKTLGPKPKWSVKGSIQPKPVSGSVDKSMSTKKQETPTTTPQPVTQECEDLCFPVAKRNTFECPAQSPLD